MYKVILFKLENNTIPDFIVKNKDCAIDGDFIGIGTAQKTSTIFTDENSLIEYLTINSYGENWGPRADGTTPIFDKEKFANNVFAECRNLNNE